MKFCCVGVVCIAAGLFAGCGNQAKPDSGKAETSRVETKPVANIQELMAGLIMPGAARLWDAVQTRIDEKGTHETKPQTPEEWAELQFIAKGLAETGNLLTMQGHAVDQENWAKHARGMTEASLRVAKAAEAKDPDKFFETGGQLYDNCKTCHDEYLEKVFTQRTSAQPVGTPLSAPPGAESK
jgi:hypothetical protein